MTTTASDGRNNVNTVTAPGGSNVQDPSTLRVVSSDIGGLTSELNSFQGAVAQEPCSTSTKRQLSPGEVSFLKLSAGDIARRANTVIAHLKSELQRNCGDLASKEELMGYMKKEHYQETEVYRKHEAINRRQIDALQAKITSMAHLEEQRVSEIQQQLQQVKLELDRRNAETSTDKAQLAEYSRRLDLQDKIFAEQDASLKARDEELLRQKQHSELLTAQWAEARERLRRHESTIANDQKNNLHSKKVITDLELKIVEQNVTISAYSADLKELREQMVQNRGMIQAHRNEITGHAPQVQELKNQLNSQQAHIRHLQLNLSASQNRELQAQQKAARENATEALGLEKRLSTAEDALKSQVNVAEQLRELLKKREKEISNTQTALSEKQKSLDVEIQANVESKTKLRDSDAQLVHAMQHTSQLRSELTQMYTKNAEMVSMLRNLRNEIEVLQSSSQHKIPNSSDHQDNLFDFPAFNPFETNDIASNAIVMDTPVRQASLSDHLTRSERRQPTSLGPSADHSATARSRSPQAPKQHPVTVLREAFGTNPTGELQDTTQSRVAKAAELVGVEAMNNLEEADNASVQSIPTRDEPDDVDDQGFKAERPQINDPEGTAHHEREALLPELAKPLHSTPACQSDRPTLDLKKIKQSNRCTRCIDLKKYCDGEPQCETCRTFYIINEIPEQYCNYPFVAKGLAMSKLTPDDYIPASLVQEAEAALAKQSKQQKAKFWRMAEEKDYPTLKPTIIDDELRPLSATFAVELDARERLTRLKRKSLVNGPVSGEASPLHKRARATRSPSVRAPSAARRDVQPMTTSPNFKGVHVSKATSNGDHDSAKSAVKASQDTLVVQDSQDNDEILAAQSIKSPSQAVSDSVQPLAVRPHHQDLESDTDDEIFMR